MSGVEAMGARLRAIIADLPAGATADADDTLKGAHLLLDRALRDADDTGSVRELARARNHLASARHALTLGAERLDDYLAAIGVAGGKPDGEGVSSSAKAERPAAEDDWWRTRVRQLCDDDGSTDRELSDLDLPKLFERLVRAARAASRDDYRDELLAARPAVGTRLPSLAVPLIRTLSEPRLPSPPDERSVARLARSLSGRVRGLLPKLPDDVPETQLRLACGLGPARSGASAEHGAVDAAVVGPILVAGLHGPSSRPTGRSA